MTTLFVLGFIFISFFVIYFTSRLLIWSLTLLVYLLVIYHLSVDINPFVYLSFTLFYLIISVLFNLKPLRQRFITSLIFFKAKSILPKISETEQLALNAGDPWYEKDIFQGKPSFTKLHNLKKFELNKEELDFINNETRELCQMIDDWQITYKEKDLPVKVWNFMREKKFFGLVIAKEYGGLGFSAAAHSDIVMKVATRSISAAVTVMVPNSLGPGELLQHYGTEEQKKYYLPRLANGDDIPCFALTGPTAGSDATSIPDEGVVTMGEYNGEMVLGIKLKNINKRYITLAPIATIIGLAFKLKDPDNLLKGLGKEGITCVLLPRGHAGIDADNRLLPLDQCFMNGVVRIKETFIPISWIIGGQKMAGEGWRMLVECLSIGRSISLPACGTASSLVAVITSSAYALVREQFKVSIGGFEGIEDKLAKTGGIAYMLNATRQFTVNAVDAGIRPSVASAIAKYHLTENGRTAITHAMDIHAGRGIIMGPNNYLARGYQGSPIGITVEGANILTRNLMIFGQGAMRCHPFIRQEYESLTSVTGLSSFDNAMFGHIGYTLQNTVRALFHSITFGVFARGYSSKFNCYYKKISRLSSYFAFVNDIALVTLGGELKRRERISARLGDVMSYLYMACATLKYYEDNGCDDSDDIFVQWVLEHCIVTAQNALVDSLDNFIMQKLGKVLKVLLFPLGKPYKEPSDKLEHKLSVALLNNSKTREKFKQVACIIESSDDPIGRVEIAFKAVLATFPIKQKIWQAVKKHQLPKGSVYSLAKRSLELAIITEDEYNQLKLAQRLTNETIQVDEFSAFELGPKNAHPSWNI
jgi:acyl-CoA dehydrogenase